MVKLIRVTREIWKILMQKKMDGNYPSINSLLEKNIHRITIKNKGGKKNDK